MTRRGPTLFALLTAVAALGCAVSAPIDLPASHSGATGGSSAAATGGSSATGGTGVTATGGTIGTGGVAATGGKVGTGGVAATGGKVGTGGVKGTGGTTTGTGGTTSSDGGTVTFTEVYTQVIANNCFGSGCHNPASSGRPSFATQSSCYTYFKNQGQLYPGQTPTKSYLYFIMSEDPTASPPSPPYMPPTPEPTVSAADLALVAAWIADGALNN